MIPLLDLKTQYLAIKAEIDEAVLGVLGSGEYILGRNVRAFEEEFAAYCGGGECIAVNSGTSALHLAFLAAGIGAGDEVITPPMTFIATTAAIAYAGATPIFVDVDDATGNIDPSLIEQKITSRTKAIVPVHLHGRMADMTPIVEIARRKNLLVIEDAAQAHGAEYRGGRAGSFGDIACFSFYAGKNLGACGEGGAALSDNPDFVKRMRLLRDWGAEEKYRSIELGYNYRMDGIQGAILRVKLRHLEDWTRARMAHAAAYDEALDSLGIKRPPTPAVGDRHVYHVYATRVARREAVRKVMVDSRIGVGMHYPIPVHLQPAFKDLGYRPGDFPVAEQIADETLSLPIYPELTTAQRDRVCSALAQAVAPERLALEAI
ncbi:DegT/DnrJ/EryC1/StrS family aminotransferase [Hyphomicrobium sp.]|jgi:dTDP-4-amino-4,6-dideoxygalactose transaminase|uniref:DegT/DnrJ/EryC1/StrS family aminotransferase n=1 Tax=Hyphomicrobium sp. TaxID=82 RepID=UPI002CB90A5C|nr:DegT/DnrJ/EryC1/StrS family aminotransferase [Hyphomicrobium sp.]HVZ06004.1 DegT/DnrJ/EryC1/StrS family aminotransferase [Hyphomicrobium sp.]